jgi:uncharacterized protein (TIGR02594 family)
MRNVLACLLVLAVSAPVLVGCSAATQDDDAEAAGGSALATAPNTNARVATGISGLFVRATPSSSSAKVGSLAAGAAIDVQCQATGESVSGNAGWDYLPKYKGYVSDHYVTKLGASFPKCGADGTTPVLNADAPAPTPSSPSPPSFTPSAGDGAGGDLVAEARRWVGTHETGDNCQPFSTALGRGCEAWCADFVEYVWQQAGMRTDGITAYAGSFLSYGDQFGTRKSRDAAAVQPGDAVVWAHTATDAMHVGMVSEVLANGDVRVISGNYSDQVMETVQARSSLMGGYGIAGFVSPAAF